MKEKSNAVLLNILDANYSGQIKSNPDSLIDVIIELKKRDLSFEEKIKFDKLMLFYFKEFPEAFADVRENTDTSSGDSKIKTVQNSNFDNDGNHNKYLALKTLAGIIPVVGYILLFIGIVGFFYILSSEDYLYESYRGLIGFVFLISNIVVALPLLALSNLIYVLIDTELNTRKTYKLLNKLLIKK